MVTDTRTTIQTERTTAKERADTANQAALWIVLAVIAFAGLGYAFYHYSNPATNPAAATSASSTQTPAANDNGNGTTMNNDTSTAPNTGTPSTTTSQPAASSDMPASTTSPSTSTQQ